MALFMKLVMVFEWFELDFYQLVPNHNDFVLDTKVANGLIKVDVRIGMLCYVIVQIVLLCNFCC